MDSSQGCNFSWCWWVVRLCYFNKMEALYATLAVIRSTEIAISLQKSDKQLQVKCYLNGKKRDASSRYWIVTNGALYYLAWKWVEVWRVAWSWRGTQRKLLLPAEISDGSSWYCMTGWWDGRVEVQKSGAGRERRRSLFYSVLSYC